VVDVYGVVTVTTWVEIVFVMVRVRSPRTVSVVGMKVVFEVVVEVLRTFTVSVRP
jgi:hypothetical protein